jgi:catechol 2,3-dioxygenase-like lactoylglutathione lyase family enzyme
MYVLSGIHHVAIGVKSLETLVSFYRNILDFTRVFGEFPEAEHPPMREVIRASRVVFSGIMFNQEPEGIFLELIQMKEPSPRSIRKDFKYGDIGVAKLTIAVSDVTKFYKEMENTLNFCSAPKHIEISGWGDYNFVYCKDPEGNLLEFTSGKNIHTQGKFGGVIRVGVSVSDLYRSKSFYQRHMDCKNVVIDDHECFSGLVDEISGCSITKVRSCVLSNSKGNGMLELFEVLEPRGRSIPFSTRWGDFGYLQVCFSCDDVSEIAVHCEKAGIDFLCKPQAMDTDKPELAGSYLYIKDPDGIPLEFLHIPLGT